MKVKDIKNELDSMLALEYLGIRIEESYSENNMFSTMITKFSVPEKSIFKDKTYLSEELISKAKSVITEMITGKCKSDELYDNEEDDLLNFIDNTCKFYAKVRAGETWTEDKGKERIKELTKQLNNSVNQASNYKEV